MWRTCELTSPRGSVRTPQKCYTGVTGAKQTKCVWYIEQQQQQQRVLPGIILIGIGWKLYFVQYIIWDVRVNTAYVIDSAFHVVYAMVELLLKYVQFM